MPGTVAGASKSHAIIPSEKEYLNLQKCKEIII